MGASTVVCMCVWGETSHKRKALPVHCTLCQSRRTAVEQSERDRTVPTLLPVFLTADRRHDQPKIVSGWTRQISRACHSASLRVRNWGGRWINCMRTHVKVKRHTASLLFVPSLFPFPAFVFGAAAYALPINQRQTVQTNPGEGVVVRLNGRSLVHRYDEHSNPASPE